MAEYPYIIGPNILKRFIQEIPSTEVPDKMTTVELEARGYKSHNYRVIIPILKFIRFLDDGGVPTSSWTNYRDKGKAGAVMASCLRVAYADLFKIYSNAQEKDTEALRNFFSTRVKKSENVLNWTVATFKALCELADFRAEAPDVEEIEAPVGEQQTRVGRTRVPQSQSGMVVNLNIQVTVPATDNADIYDKFFAAMKKHLLGPEE